MNIDEVQAVYFILNKFFVKDGCKIKLSVKHDNNIFTAHFLSMTNQGSVIKNKLDYELDLVEKKLSITEGKKMKYLWATVASNLNNQFESYYKSFPNKLSHSAEILDFIVEFVESISCQRNYENFNHNIAHAVELTNGLSFPFLLLNDTGYEVLSFTVLEN